jgi:hypothetical protein
MQGGTKMDIEKLQSIFSLLPYYPHWFRVWVYILFVLILATALVYIHYSGHARDTRKRVANIEFESSEPFITTEKIRLPNIEGSWKGCYYRVRIVNTSDESSLKIKYLKVTNLTSLEGSDFKPWENAEDLILDWDSMQPQQIAPKESVYAPFARLFPPDLQQLLDGALTGSPHQPHFRFTASAEKYHMKMRSNVPQGKHRFKLSIFFENAPPAERMFEVQWETPSDTVEAMAKEIKIRMLTPSK